MRDSALGHLLAGRLQNLAFTLGETVNAVGGNLFKDRIHLAADKIAAARFLGFSGPPPGALRGDAERGPRGPAPGKWTPVAKDSLRPSAPPHESNAGEHPAQMSGVGGVA